MWCAQCGQEYRPGFSRCSDCEFDLVDELPAPAASVGNADDRVGHDLVEYDLAELTDEQTKTLELLFRGAHLAFGWEPPRRLVVATSVADEVGDILDFVDASIEAEPAPPVEAGRPAWPSGARPSGPRRSGTWNGPPRRAGRGRRWCGAAVDSAAVSLCTWPIRLIWGATIFATWSTLAAWTAVRIVYAVAPVAVWGKTPGKLVVRTRVVRIDGLEPPGWRVAALRGVVPVLPDLAVGVVFLTSSVSLRTAGAFAFLGYWMVYVPVLGNERRGLHDRAAGTIVMRDPG